MLKTFISHKMFEYAIEMIGSHIAKNFCPDRGIKIGAQYRYIEMEFQDTQNRLVYVGDIEIVSHSVTNMPMIKVMHGSQCIIDMTTNKKISVNRVTNGAYNIFMDCITAIF